MIIGNGKEKDSVVDLVETIIDPLYANMKEDNDTKDLNTWEVPLNLAYITYTEGRIRMLRHVQADLGHEGVSASRNRRVHGQPQRHDQACQEGLDVVLYLFISTFII